MNKQDNNIQSLIYEIRGKQVMLDSDLAKLYECVNGTKTINQAVSRHLDRFPKDFCFKLTNKEYSFLRSQIGTSKIETRGGRQYLPYAFTEQGVAMLASILRTQIASQISIDIMRAFSLMRKYVSTNLIEQKYINSLVVEDHKRIKKLEEFFQNSKGKSSEIYFNGQIFDAYSKIYEIFNLAVSELIIIDSYADNVLLDIIKRLKVKVTIITRPNNLLTKQDIIRYNKQYHNLNIIYNKTFHDRYFILDQNIVYHCGTSINRIGYKTFSINLINDNDLCKLLMNRVVKLKSQK